MGMQPAGLIKPVDAATQSKLEEMAAHQERLAQTTEFNNRSWPNSFLPALAATTTTVGLYGLRLGEFAFRNTRVSRNVPKLIRSPLGATIRALTKPIGGSLVRRKLIEGVGKSIVSRLAGRLALGLLPGIGTAISLAWLGYEIFDLARQYNKNHEMMDSVGRSNILSSDPGHNWMPQETILAGCGQSEVAQMGQYTQRLAKLLDRGDIASPLAAQRDIEKNGGISVDQLGFVRTQNAVTSQKTTPGFVKGENKPRRVLLVRGKDYDSDFNDIRASLKRNYGLKDEDIIELNEPSEEQLEEAYKTLNAFSKGKNDAEALVIYSAHGLSFRDDRLPTAEQCLQGAYQGAINIQPEFGLSEFRIKELHQTYLADYQSVTTVMDACHSGAFITKGFDTSDQKKHTRPATPILTLVTPPGSTRISA